jgi:two-component system LytT family sensor kinase
MPSQGRLHAALSQPVTPWLKAAAWSCLAWICLDFLADYGDSFIWGCITPGVLWLVNRRPVGRRTWPRAVPIHLAASLAASCLTFPWMQAQRWLLAILLDEPAIYWRSTPAMFFRMSVQGVMLYFQVAAVGHGIHYYRAYKNRDLRASRLEGQLAQAQLQVLRMQLHPHFLFNTLHTISALMHSDLRAADRILALLGDLLRDSLDKLGAQEVTLKQELDFIDRYLEIERTRFRDRLTIDKPVDPEVLDALVPNLVLQPLVENAIRHGIARRAGAGRVTISACREGGDVVLAVSDDGPGIPEEGAVAHGVGLANTQARLEQLYGAAHRFELKNRPQGGLQVTLKFPFRPAPAAAVA